MPELSFQPTGIRVIPDAATPTLAVGIAVSNGLQAERIQSLHLQAQVRIETARRSYSTQEKERLVELFGEPLVWGRSLKPLLWTLAGAMARSFVAKTEVELLLPCTFDLTVAMTKFFQALDGGEVPLSFCFSGTVFYERADGALQVVPVPWTAEAVVPLPVARWTELIDHYHPRQAAFWMDRALVDRLDRYRAQRGLLNLESAVEHLLGGAA